MSFQNSKGLSAAIMQWQKGFRRSLLTASATMMMALVVSQTGRPRAGTVLGVIDKEHIADTVASSVRIYPR